MKRKWQILFYATLLLTASYCNTKEKKMNGEIIYDEAVLKSFVISIPGISKGAAMAWLDSTLNSVASDSITFRKTASFFETTFGDPNSTYRNEDLLIKLLKAKIKSPCYDSIAKDQTRGKLLLAMQNRPHSAANDFSYTTPAGYKKKMYDLNGDFTILYFYNPECEACKEMKAALIASPVVKNKVATGQLNVLAIYTDKDERLWLDHLKEMPDQWKQGRDENEYLFKNNVYDLKAIPSVYLLGKSKDVLLKDCTNISLIEQQLIKKI